MKVQASESVAPVRFDDVDDAHASQLELPVLAW
jgi:uncharacterized protein YqfB (UPF0267 family)